MEKIEPTIYIEDLIQQLPEAVSYLMKKQIRCIVCGDPLWGTLEEAAREKGYSDQEIAQMVEELNAMVREKEKNINETHR